MLVRYTQGGGAVCVPQTEKSTLAATTKQAKMREREEALSISRGVHEPPPLPVRVVPSEIDCLL